MSRYYRSITRYEALRIVADAAHLPLLIFFALFFAAGVYVGRWSVVLETRQRRKHLAEAVRGIVDGVLAGTSKTEGAVEDDGKTTREIIEGVLEGLRAGGAARAGGTGRASSSAANGRSVRRSAADAASGATGSSARRRVRAERTTDSFDDVLSRELRSAEAAAAATKGNVHEAGAENENENENENKNENENEIENENGNDAEALVEDVEMMDAATPSASSAGARSGAPNARAPAIREDPVKHDDEHTYEHDTAGDGSGDDDEVVSSRAADPPAEVPESPTRTHAREAEWATRQAEIERQRAEALRRKKAAKSARLVNERVETYRRGLEEREALESAMGDARAEAQRSFERDGVHDLASAGCLEHALHRLGLLPDPDEDRDAGKVEAAYKKALARNHPDRSASRGDDLRASARCEEAFKLLQAAKARWDAVGKPTGSRARRMAASALGGSYSRAPSGPARQPQSSSRSAHTFTSPHTFTEKGGRSWQPGGSTPGGSTNPGDGYGDAWREQAKRTAAATADALRREEERMRLELEEQRRLEREREAREAFERKLQELGRKTSGGDDATWVQGSDASEEGTPRHPAAANGKDDRKKRPPPNDFQ